MTIVTFVLGLVLIAAGAGGLVASYDLLPTELGLLYACCGAILVSGGVVTVAIGVAVLRLEALTQMVHFAAAVDDLPDEGEVAAARCMREDHAAHEPDAAPAELEAAAEEGEAPAVEPQPADAHAAAAEPVEEALAEAPVEEGVAAGAPSVADLEQALAAAAPPTLVGHYSAGGANYKIFSDGSIEAETEGGAFRFASMDEFKAYLASERAYAFCFCIAQRSVVFARDCVAIETCLIAAPAALQAAAEEGDALAVEAPPVDVHVAAADRVEEALTEATVEEGAAAGAPERRRSRTGARRRGSAADPGRPLQRRRRQLQDLLRRLDRGRDRGRRLPLRLDGRLQGLSRQRARRADERRSRCGAQSGEAACSRASAPAALRAARRDAG